ncbi:hypothetical protein IHV09_08600 [Fictibacillus sp. 23RED33]|uniref:hypothetical protein n=1 Tax=Fictibacillus sp. 23RED33 TaxID=2745879 RepID=UPI0018CC9949|nr:hypothetical protein [Fictibacillus sp. 23RED33]MBH0173614.1 hypothetical protein [Fictibacillus sp. 23RED33]
MENQLKNLNHTLDKQISSTPVFTKNDEQNILLAIRNSSSKKKTKPKNAFVPRMLTAALFAGVIFTSYTLIDSYLTPETATEIEIKKPEIRYAQELSQASSMISYDENTNILKINGSVKNTTEFNSEKFETRITILNKELQAAIGSKTLKIDETPQQGYLKPDEPFTFTKEITLEKPISESALKDALQIEVYTETKTLTSFIISDIKFTGKKAEEPVVDEEQPVVEENEKESEEKDSSSITEKEKPEQDTTDSVIEESPKPTDSLDNLEEQYGKKKTPFNGVEVTKKDGYFFIKGITIGTTLDQALQILGPYDKHSEKAIHSPIYATWNLKNSLKESENTGFFVELPELKKDQKIGYLSYNTDDKVYVENLIVQLGEPIDENPGVKFFYAEKSKQMLSIKDEGSYYEITLHFETNLNLYTDN